MKVRSKDEIIIKLVEELEKYEELSHIPQEEIDMGHSDQADEALITLGKINILKWVLQLQVPVTKETLMREEQDEQI